MSEEQVADCVFRIDHPTIKLSGKRTCTFYLSNPGKRAVLRKELDGCLHHGDVCDWLVETDDDAEPRAQVFTELKGHDWEKAGQQLEATLTLYPPNQNGFVSRCYIVGTSFPGFRARGQKLIDRFQKRFAVQLFTVRDGKTESL